MARFEYERPSAVEIPEEELAGMATVLWSGGGIWSAPKTSRR